MERVKQQVTSRAFLRLAVPAAVAVLLPLAYVWLSAPEVGFPLDDGWIHQTYARNLAERGRWEYVPGEVSAGSTAPLWTVLLAIGYLLDAAGPDWAYACGAAAFGWLVLAAMTLWRRWWPTEARRDWLAGLALAVSWPLIWAAASGMETILFAAIGMTLCVLTIGLPARVPVGRAAGIGLLGGLLILTRPDGLVLVLLVFASYASRRQVTRKGLLALLAGLAGALVPYFLFNLSSSGAIWPNTFYAKQAEYAALLARPLWRRLIELLAASLGASVEGGLGLSAAHLVLAPGVLAAAWSVGRADVRQRQLRQTVPFFWAAGHVLLYAWRLPVQFQHARYLMPVMPIWIVAGVLGWGKLLAGLARNPARRRLAWLIGRVAAISFACVFFYFAALGSQQYQADVGFINGEMVAVAHWLERNTPADALIAAHDIGAIGYFARRPLLDLAGLISPEIVPFLDDENALADYVWDSQAEYLVTAPGWTYASITQSPDARRLYDTDYLWTKGQGLNSMEVYHLGR